MAQVVPDVGWNEFYRLLTAALGGGGAVAFFTALFKFALSRNKQEDEQTRLFFLQYDKRISVLEASEKECREENVKLRQDIGKLSAELKLIQVISSTANIQCDSAGIITHWNEAASFLFGWSREEAVGRPFTMIIPRRWREQASQAFTIAVAEHRAPTSETVLRLRESHAQTSEGREIPVSIFLEGWTSQSGEWFYGAEIRRR